MALKRNGKRPASKTKTPEAETAVGDILTAHNSATAKLTISVKRRLANGDEVFIAPGVEIQCGADDLDAKQAEVETRVNTWMEGLLEAYPDVDLEDEDEEEEGEEEEGEEEEEPEEEEEGEEEELTEAEVAKMKLADLKALVKEEELDIDVKGMKLAELRTAVAEELFGEEGEEEEEGDEEEEEGEEEGYTEEELGELKLDALQEICTSWEIGDPKLKKGAKLGAKKAAFIAHILEAQDEE